MENVRRKKKNGRFVLAVVTAFLLLFASACGQVEGGGAPGADVSGQTVMEGGGSGGSSGPLEDSRGPGGESGSGDEAGEAAKEMTVHFLDVGQGDATLILCGGEAMLIDAGDNGQGTNVQNYLRKQGVEALKYVVCTHPDEDHIGGMDVILYKFECETVFVTEEEKDTDTYRDVADAMAQKGYSRTLPVPGQQYPLGDAAFTILGPSAIGSGSNDNSIAILLTHGEDVFLFTGDAEEEEESALLAGGLPLDADVYKTGHHGSRTSSSKDFLEAVSPVCAVISCGEGNSYGHPHAETLNNLRAMGVSVYRTDEQGTIVAASSGRGITWNCSPSETWQAGEPTGSAASQGTSQESAASQGTSQESAASQGTSQESSGVQGAGSSQGTAQDAAADSADPAYICNTNTYKFHYPSCGSVKQMKESNKLPTNASRDELIQQGYDPCKKCKP
ncbi:ComEC/Rec2 family competence protein [uncultured Acetatifactor sp.]|uniref:ComEC/Rec2 family competence protein n=1 Tax=uncultured Acetatifactor sp. TaxID=1671927 RepID=UPI002635A15F|nr:ComEC/Rec2 family competence protein [uncultured Acetatifactor sp.]